MADTSVRGIAAANFCTDSNITNDPSIATRFARRRGNANALRRNAEIWKFALKSVFASLKPRKLKKVRSATPLLNLFYSVLTRRSASLLESSQKGASQEEIETAQRDAATFIRDGLLKLGPSFVKLGQVVSTR